MFVEFATIRFSVEITLCHDILTCHVFTASNILNCRVFAASDILNCHVVFVTVLLQSGFYLFLLLCQLYFGGGFIYNWKVASCSFVTSIWFLAVFFLGERTRTRQSKRATPRILGFCAWTDSGSAYIYSYSRPLLTFAYILNQIL